MGDAAVAGPDTEADDGVRPLVHFTPRRGWLSDPNGLVSVAGRHHLFFQHYPDGTAWGAMHWGHAVSDDFVTWQHLPVALAPDEQGLIYSGSAVTDRSDTAGFGAGALVAVFTYHVDGHESQALAWSHDGGQTFAKYSSNPVIATDLQRPMCRDPKVFWFGGDADGHWVMALAATTEIWIYTSDDLRHWTRTDAVAGFEHGDGSLETPDLFELDADDGTRQWVMTAGIMHGAPAGGTGTAMLVGAFDGQRFVPTGDSRWVDHGAHFYAAQSWNDVADQRRVWIAWMGNWADGAPPTSARWRGQMSIARELTLRSVDDEYLLHQTPIRELDRVRQVGVDERAVVIADGDARRGVHGRALDATIIVTASATAGELRAIATRGDDAAAVVVEPASGLVTVHLPSALTGRVAEGDVVRQAGVPPGDVNLRILLDASSIEVLCGPVAISEVLLADPLPWELTVTSDGDGLVIDHLRIHPLDPNRVAGVTDLDPQGALTWQP